MHRAAPRGDDVLTLTGLGVRIDHRVVLGAVTCSVSSGRVTVLLGPSGAGKSTLLRTIAGLLAVRPGVVQWGSARYRDEPLRDGNRPALVLQDMRWFVSSVRDNLVAPLRERLQLSSAMQRVQIERALIELGCEALVSKLDEQAAELSRSWQRRLAVVRGVLAGEPLVMLDEPTAGLSEDEADEVLAVIERASKSAAFLVVTHHQRHARRIGNDVLLLGGGRIVAAADAPAFFEGRLPLAHHFLATGGLPLPAPDARTDELRDGVTPPPPLPPEALHPQRGHPPRNFSWLIPGRLGGMPRPGIVASLDQDLAGLRALGVSLLVTLEEASTIDAETLGRHGLRGLHFPIADMGVPTRADALAWCSTISRALREGAVVVLHCRAGQGRTGTMLACQLIAEGEAPVAALERVRAVDPKWVTSPEQVRFLSCFAEGIAEYQRPERFTVVVPPAAP